MVMKSTERAYLAGYIDADGCIAVNTGGRKSTNISISVRLTTHCEPLAQELDLRYGGTLSQSKTPQGDFIWTWAIGGKSATEFLNDVFPYLRYKKRQAELALDLISTLGRVGVRVSLETKIYRSQLALEICRLNQNNLSRPRVTKTMRQLMRISRGKEL